MSSDVGQRKFNKKVEVILQRNGFEVWSFGEYLLQSESVDIYVSPSSIEVYAKTIKTTIIFVYFESDDREDFSTKLKIAYQIKESLEEGLPKLEDELEELREDNKQLEEDNEQFWGQVEYKPEEVTPLGNLRVYKRLLEGAPEFSAFNIDVGGKLLSPGDVRIERGKVVLEAGFNKESKGE